MTKNERHQRFDNILARIESSSIAKPGGLKGCSDKQIEDLESRYQITLPETYRWFLQTMGMASGRLFAHDHVNPGYENVFDLTHDMREYWISDEAKECDERPPSNFVLPDDTLLTADRLVIQFECIECVGGADAAVYYFNVWDWKFEKHDDSVLDWLDSNCGYCEEAIASGYFDDRD